MDFLVFMYRSDSVDFLTVLERFAQWFFSHFSTGPNICFFSVFLAKFINFDFFHIFDRSKPLDFSAFLERAGPVDFLAILNRSRPVDFLTFLDSYGMVDFFVFGGLMNLWIYSHF